MQKNISNIYKQVGKIYCHDVIFYRFFNWNLMFCLKIVEHRYRGSDRFLPIKAVMKG